MLLSFFLRLICFRTCSIILLTKSWLRTSNKTMPMVTKPTSSKSCFQVKMCRISLDRLMLQRWLLTNNLPNNCKLTIKKIKVIQKMWMRSRVAINRTLTMKPIWQQKKSKSTVLQQKMPANSSHPFLQIKTLTRMTINMIWVQILLI